MRPDATVASLEDFEREWSMEYAEWLAIAVGLGASASAHDVSEEQRRRMRERGEISVLDTAFARSNLGTGWRPRLVK